MVDRLAGQITLTALSHTFPPFASRLTNSSQTPRITSVSTEQIHYTPYCFKAMLIPLNSSSLTINTVTMLLITIYGSPQVS